MLPRSKPSRRSMREQAKLPGQIRTRKPKGDDIEPRKLSQTQKPPADIDPAASGPKRSGKTTKAARNGKRA